MGSKGQRVSSWARARFREGYSDVEHLIRDYHEATARERASAATGEHYLRSAVLLLVASWECYIEFAILDCAVKRITSAHPDEYRRTIARTFELEIKDRKDKAVVIHGWLGDGWRHKLMIACEAAIQMMNTPDSRNIQTLSEAYLGRDVTEAWTWPGMSARSARARLDRVIALRGRCAHTVPFRLGAELRLNRPEHLQKREVINAAKFIHRLVDRTQETLGLTR